MANLQLLYTRTVQKAILIYPQNRKGAAIIMTITVEELRLREVINVSDGARLGYVNDIEFDITAGKVVALIVPGQWNLSKIFGKNEDSKIPWEAIKKIGGDIILVDITDQKARNIKTGEGWIR